MRTYEQNLEEFIKMAVERRQLYKFGSKEYKLWEEEIKRLNEALFNHYALTPPSAKSLTFDFNMQGHKAAVNEDNIVASPSKFLEIASSFSTKSPYEMAFKFGLETGFKLSSAYALHIINKKIDEMV